MSIKKSIETWVDKKLSLLHRDRPLLRLLMYPATGQNAYMQVTRDYLERMGVKVRLLETIDPKEILRLAPRYDLLHLYSVSEYHSPFATADLSKQTKAFTNRYLAQTMARKLGLPVFWTFYNEPITPDADKWYFKKGRRLLLSQTDKLVYPSEATRQRLLTFDDTLPSSKLMHLPHHNYGDFFPKQVSRRTALGHLGVKPKGHVYICFGGIHAYKGLADLIPLFGRYPMREHTLIIAGTPSNEQYAQTVERLCAEYENVHAFLRFISPDEVQYYLNASDVFVMPYKPVLNSGSLMVALAFGLAVVAPNAGAIPEIVNSLCSVLIGEQGGAAMRGALKASLTLDLPKAKAEARRISKMHKAELVTKRLLNAYLAFYPKRGQVEEDLEEL